MKWVLLALVMFLAACTHLPAIAPVDSDRLLSIQEGCRSHFPRGRWQLVHAINAQLRGGRQATFIGVVVLSSRDRSLDCVLMTLEGMVLFEAAHDGSETTVRRAVGPFDNARFAEGVMADIRMLLFEPQGSVIASGMTAGDIRVCRYRGARETIVDLMASPDGGWQIQQYNARGKVVRHVSGDAADSRGISPRMVIDAGSGRQAYHLSLTLVEATALP